MIARDKHFFLLCALALFIPHSGFASVTLLSPPNDTTFATANDLKNVTFRWTKESNTNQMAIYMIQVDTVSDFKYPLPLPLQPTQDTSFRDTSQFPIVIPPGKYYWRVYAIGQQRDSSVPFQFTIAQAVQEPPVTFYRIPGGLQKVYCSDENGLFLEDGPFLFTIGASSPKGIKTIYARVNLHRGKNVDPLTLPLLQIPQSVEFPGKLYGNYWYPPVSLLPGDTIIYGFTGIDSLGYMTQLDSSAFKILIRAPDTLSNYSRSLASACQYVYELTDTTGRQVDSTRGATRPDNAAAGLIHKYNTFCGPCAGASCLQWLGEGKVDSSFVDSLAEIFKTNVAPPAGSYPGNLASGAAAKLRGKYMVSLWQDTADGFTMPKLDTGVKFHNAPPQLSDYSGALKDSADVIVSVGWWQDSAGVKMIRRGGHFLTASGFRADGHFVAGMAVNDSTGFVEVMDPDCGRWRWMRWGGAGPNTHGMDSVDYSGLSAGMTALVESMVSIGKFGQGGTGVSEPSAVPQQPVLLWNAPNPFSFSTEVVVRGAALNQPASKYSLKVYDVLGREAADITGALRITDSETATADFNGAGFPAGIYYYKFAMGKFSVTKPMLLIK